MYVTVITNAINERRKVIIELPVQALIKYISNLLIGMVYKTVL